MADPSKPLSVLLAELTALAVEHVGLEPELARQHLVHSPNSTAREYADALDLAADNLEHALQLAQRMVRESRVPKFQITRGGGSSNG